MKTLDVKHTLGLGDWVAVVLKNRVAPMRCYVGQIQAIDERGIRITLVDWMVRQAIGADIFISHNAIETALVESDESDSLSLFFEEAKGWQAKLPVPSAFLTADERHKANLNAAGLPDQ